MTWRVVILAAGQGTRMNSDLPKVLHPLAGEPLLAHVLRLAESLPVEKIVVVVGHRRDLVVSAFEGRNVRFVVQDPQHGTGHAVQQAEEELRGHDGSTLILYGDVPLLRRSTLLELMEEHECAANAATVLTARVADPAGYGRIVRGGDGAMLAIVEHKDLAPEQRPIDEINSGIYTFRTAPLLEALGNLRADNAQKELYLTDTIVILRGRGLRVGTHVLRDGTEIAGINTPAQLLEAEAIRASRMRDGTTDCRICAQGAARAGFPVLIDAEHAFLAVWGRPYNSGQVSVHPKRHVLRHASLREEERADLWRLAQIGSRAVEAIYHPQGLNAGYVAAEPGSHLALQIVPRWVGDTNFLPILSGETLLPESPHRTFQRMRDYLSGQQAPSA